MKTFREHMQEWIAAFEDRGTMYMAELLQEMLNEGRDTQADLEAEHAHWMHIRKTTRLYGTRHSEAWAKSDSIAEVLRWYNT
ncbi:MAG: hypothetical protein CL573_00845 [Alphaproteobacteria bacterium]|nr:hypothetical protein [Alphaproteobacteria bacterium]|tara:strand:- start:637 stop:882 length:246 start_codon:yes stop_codon:yes gene_type:complete